MSFAIAGWRGVVGFASCHQGALLLSAEGEKTGVLAVLGDFKAILGPQRWSRPPQSMCKYPWDCWGSCLRLLPTAGVCDQRSGASLRLLLTAGVCEQRLGG